VRQPLRVIVDSQARTPTSARLLALPGDTVLATLDGECEAALALAKAGATVWELPGDGGRVDLAALLVRLARDRACNEVLIEAGATLAGAALRAGLIDELVVYIAPHLLGDEARGLLRLPGLTAMSDRIELDWHDVRMVGADLRLNLRPRRSAQATEN